MHMDRPVFVFGSDIAGRHDNGDALVALRTRGAIYGRGRGPQGNAYAIPTRSPSGHPRARDDIAESVTQFLHFARMRPWALFDIALIGCGMAGYSARDIAPMFAAAPHNVMLPEAFERVLAGAMIDDTFSGEAL